LGLRAKLGLLVLVPFAFVAVAGLVAFEAVSSARDATDRVERSTSLILTANLVVKDAIDAETGVRGFLLVGDAEFLAPYDAAVQTFPARVDRLERLAGENPDQLALVAEVREEFARFVEDLAEPAIAQRRQNPVSMDDLTALTVDSKEVLDTIRENIDTIVTEERTAGGAEAALQRARGDEAAGVAVLSAIAASLLALVTALVSARLMAVRIGAVTRGAHALAADGVRTNLSPVGHDEIAELGHSFNAMADQLERRQAELEGVNRELESFSYTVSHDLRAPLRSIAGFAQILEEDHQSELSAEGRRLLSRIRAAAGRMSELIDALLELARVSTGALSREPVDVSQLAEDVVAELRSREPGRQVRAVIAPGLHTTGDPRLLRVVLENLVGNAWKFTGKRSHAHIWVRVGPLQPGHTGFVVADDGAGFAMEYADTLFSPFRRLHSEEDFEGTGIGLATVHRIVERHGGTIEAEGTPGEGASFTVMLPR
jgi:signal transduction histidine kinase